MTDRSIEIRDSLCARLFPARIFGILCPRGNKTVSRTAENLKPPGFSSSPRTSDIRRSDYQGIGSPMGPIPRPWFPSLADPLGRFPKTMRGFHHVLKRSLGFRPVPGFQTAVGIYPEPPFGNALGRLLHQIDHIFGFRHVR